MKKVFIKNIGEYIEYIHLLPFHKKHGIGESEEELNKRGKVVFMDESTKQEPQKGYIQKRYFDESDQIVKFRLVEKEETDENYPEE